MASYLQRAREVASKIKATEEAPDIPTKEIFGHETYQLQLEPRPNSPPEGIAPFKGEHTSLYPFIGKRVVTPKGAGKLWRVFTNSIGVVLDSSSDKVTFFDGPQQIHPLSDTRKLKEKQGLLHRSSTKNDR